MKTFEVSHVGIEGKSMVRDLHSKAVLNVDREGLRAYRDRVTQMEAVEESKRRLDALEGNITAIKGLLQQLVGSKAA